MDKSYSLSVKSNELQTAVKHLHKLLPKVKPKPSYPILDVIIKLESVELRLVGMSQILKCKNKNVFSFSIPFQNLYSIISGHSNPDFVASVTDGKIKVENREYSSVYIKLIHPENVQSLDLPMNTTALDILALRNKYSEEEIKSKNYLELLEKYESRIQDDVLQALKLLSKYGITVKELNRLIDKKISEHQ